ncbi:hypothetical protein ACFQMA_16630 [Halosimplex aquaticum]|uniref:Small CPxCG-related zinc finger protein n=1 Tax=Halosimplex aquaticum TaxID=3026162 RepID=A0ABD5Y3J6_9EURY|nr:hypothetical protein [Halosimplex aquaticum]
MNALCPNCRSAEGEVTDRNSEPEAGLRVEFCCPECDHDWDVTL